MSTTYLTDLRASAIRSTCGVIYYCLEEETYESNVHPRHPRWSKVAFGTHQQVMQRVLRAASAIDGGCFADPGRSLTPSAYVTRWRRALAEPRALPWEGVTLVLGSSFYDIPSSKEALVKSILRSHCVELPWSAVEQYKRQCLQLTLDVKEPAHLRALAGLTNARDDEMGTWRVLNNAFGHHQGEADLTTPLPTVRRTLPLDGRCVWGLQGTRSADDGAPIRMYVKDGLVQNVTGWRYQLKGSFINDEVPAIEQAQAGSAEAAINVYRKMVDSAPVVAAHAMLSVTSPKGNEAWVTGPVRAFRRLSEALASSSDGCIQLSVANLIRLLSPDLIEGCFEPGQARVVDPAQWHVDDFALRDQRLAA